MRTCRSFETPCALSHEALPLVKRSKTANRSSDCLPLCCLCERVSMEACHLCQGTRLSAVQRRAARSGTNQNLKPIRCFKTTETGATDRQLSSNTQPSSTSRRCDPAPRFRYVHLIILELRDTRLRALNRQCSPLRNQSMVVIALLCMVVFVICINLAPIYLGPQTGVFAGLQGQPVSSSYKQSGSRQVALCCWACDNCCTVGLNCP